MRNKKRYVGKMKGSLLVLLVILCLTVGIELGKKWERYEFVRVVDGDTIVVRSLRNKEETRLRMMGINAPEMGKCYFAEAEAILMKSLEGKKVTYRMFGRDGFGRFLGVVYADKVDVAEKMVEGGAAVAYDALDVHDDLKPSMEYFDKLQKLEEKPKREKVGIWSDLCLK